LRCTSDERYTKTISVDSRPYVENVERSIATFVYVFETGIVEDDSALKTQIFISYSSNDQSIAEKICALLESDGIGCWIAPRDVLPGSIYAEELIKAIDNSDALVLLCSRHTSDSVHVRSEVEHAFSHRKVIFPVRLEDVELGKALEYFLGSSHWLVAWDAPLEACVKHLAESIRKVLNTSVGVQLLETNIEPEEAVAGPPREGHMERSNNLPAQTTRLIGRENAVEEVVRLLKREDVRLVTLTGPGGTGKTRLGLQVAAELIDEYANGVFFVPLAPISDTNLIISTIAQILGVHNVSGGSIDISLKNFLRYKQILLLLDNFEQIISAAPVIAGLLSDCPTLNVLVTSREVLHLGGEHDYSVPPLTIPEGQQNRGFQDASLADLTQFASVRLFIERALAIMPAFEVTNENAPAIAEICHRLDGLPLAIELAVARIQILTPFDILARLERRLPLLGKGARDLPARQRTLAGTIEWSYELLDSDEKVLFGRIAVFVGGCTLDAAEAVCHAKSDSLSEIDVMEGFASLADKSLIKRTGAASGQRFSMLETIHAYAVKRLEASGEVEEIQRRHAMYMISLSERVEVGIRGPEQLQWRDRMSDELNNFRASLQWLVQNDPNAALKATGRLWWFFQVAGLASEGLEWFEILSKRPGISDSTRAWAMNRLGVLAAVVGEYERAMQLGTEGLRLSRSLGDNAETAAALSNFSLVIYLTGDLSKARSVCEESLVLAGETGDPWILGRAKRILGLSEGRLGNYDRGAGLLEECLALFREVGDNLEVAYVLRNLGFVLLISGNHNRAAELCRESLSISKEMGDRWSMARALIHLASAAALNEKKAKLAARLFGVAEALYREIGAQVAPSEKATYDNSIALAREAVGNDEIFDALWMEGFVMTLDDAIQYALQIDTVESR
jgi:predicted ATPase